MYEICSIGSIFMITIIHGEDITKSRKHFIEQKNQYINRVNVDGATVTLTEIMQIFEGSELFASEKYIFLEDIFSKRKKNKETDQIIEVIKQHQGDSTIFFWESKNLTLAILKQWNNAIIKQFKLPQTMFSLLDALKPNNEKKLIQLFHQTLADEEVSFVFAMLIRQFRLLLSLSTASENRIEEIKRISPWQKSKLEKQIRFFSIDTLKAVYNKLFQIEYSIKTGTLNLSLEQAIDFFLLEL